jgi:hypothetical protein
MTVTVLLLGFVVFVPVKEEEVSYRVFELFGFLKFCYTSVFILYHFCVVHNIILLYVLMHIYIYIYTEY